MDPVWNICPYTYRFSSRVHAFARMAFLRKCVNLSDQTRCYDGNKPFAHLRNGTFVPQEDALQNKYCVKSLLKSFLNSVKKILHCSFDKNFLLCIFLFPDLCLCLTNRGVVLSEQSF